MKKLFYISFCIFLFISNANALTLQVTCQGNDLYNLSATSPVSVVNSYTWYLIKDGTTISTVTNSLRTYSYIVDPSTTGEGNYQLKVTYVNFTLTPKSETSNSHFCNIARPNFAVNFNNSSLITICSNDSVITILPVYNTITSSSLKIYNTTGNGGPRGTEILSSNGPSNTYGYYNVPPFYPGNYYRIEYTAYSNCGTAVAIKYLYINNSCKAGSFAAENHNHSLKLYPNPVESILSFEQTEEIDIVKIFTIQGELKNSYEKLMNNSIDMSNLESGIYFVHLYQANGNVSVNKILKK